MRSPAAQKALFTEFAQIWGDLPPCKRLPEVIYHDVDEDPGINLARIRENKELADRGDTAMQHSIGAKLDICVSRFPNLAPRLDKAIRHYYGCVEWPITRAQLARYLERQGDCVAMENILRLAVVEDNLRQKGSDTSYFTINQLLCEYLRPLNIFDAAAQPLVRRLGQPQYGRTVRCAAAAGTLLRHGPKKLPGQKPLYKLKIGICAIKS